MAHPQNAEGARVALPTAQVIAFADFRKPAAPVPTTAPMFEPDEDRPGMDINRVGRTLEALAKVVASGAMDKERLAAHLSSLAVNALAAVRAGHDLDHRVLLAETVISHQHGGAEGKALKAIIKAEFDNVRRENRAAQIAANREARKPKGKGH